MTIRPSWSVSRRQQIVWVAAAGVLTLLLCAYVVVRPPSRPGPTGAATKAPSSTERSQKVILVLGDDYAAGTGASQVRRSWASRLGEDTGATVVNDARGGTGYLRRVPTGGKAACGRPVCPRFGQMIRQAARESENPDLVIVQGGRNDVGLLPPTDETPIAAFYRALRKAFHSARIVAINPLGGDDPIPTGFAELGSRVEVAVSASGGTYLDIGQPLVGHSNLVLKGGVQPNDEGHAAIERAILKRLRTAHLISTAG